MLHPETLCQCLIDHDLRFFAGVPDSLLAGFCASVERMIPASDRIVTANEGAAVASAGGYYLATGRAGVVYMQNSGLGNAVNPLVSFADDAVYAVPMLLVIGWRGRPGVHDEPQHVTQGRITPDLLDVMGIEYRVLNAQDYVSQIDALLSHMRQYSKPVALLVREGTLSKQAYTPPPSRYTLTREAALAALLGVFGEQDAVVSTTGKTSRELYELRERRGEGHERDFLTVGSMGHAVSIAHGLSMNTTGTVWCIDGDGAFLMHMGALAVIGSRAGANFKYVLINNGAHESVGGFATAAFDIDVPGVLRACGFTDVFVAETAEDTARYAETMRTCERGALVVLTRQGSRADLGRPASTPAQNKAAFMGRV